MATVDDKKVIFSMVGVSKTIQQNQKQAGKSTLMKIIAGLDQQYQGNVVWAPGYTVGYLPQDPPLNEEKTVKENVMEGVQHVYDALAEYDEIKPLEQKKIPAGLQNFRRKLRCSLMMVNRMMKTRLRK